LSGERHPATIGRYAVTTASSHLKEGKAMIMQELLDWRRVAPGALAVMRGLEDYVARSGLEPGLLELAKARASQLNGCAYCLDMHTKDARAGGETEQRLYALPVWRETPFYTDRERAALAWAEAVTLLASHELTEELYRDTRRYFSEEELVDLTLALVAINGWNRLAVAFRTVPGSYRPKGSEAVPAGR
jgi:AhpD family alkylhydroperoxidase